MAQCDRCQDAAWCRVRFAFDGPWPWLSQAGGTVKLSCPFDLAVSDEFSETRRKWRVD